MIKIFIIIFTVLLGVVLTLYFFTKGKGASAKSSSKKNIDKFRESVGIPLSYILLFGILYHILWVRPYLTYNWTLTSIAILAMIAIDLFTGVTPENWEKSPQRKKARFHLNAGLLLLLIYIVVSANGWDWDWKQKNASTPPRTHPNSWQLCWEKVPDYKGVTSARSKCLNAKIETRSTESILISYFYSSGKGVQRGFADDGVSYAGEWRDAGGWGRWHLKFVSPDTAFGWSDDKGSGYKQPNVLERQS